MSNAFIFLCQFLSYFLDVFFASFLSLTHFPPLLLQTRGHDHLVCSRPFVRLFARSWITQKVRAVFWSEICTDWRFSVIETLAVILNCRWQVKRLKVLSAAFGLPACRRLLFPLLHAEKERLRNAVANRVPASCWVPKILGTCCDRLTHSAHCST